MILLCRWPQLDFLVSVGLLLSVFGFPLLFIHSVELDLRSLVLRCLAIHSLDFRFLIVPFITVSFLRFVTTQCIGC